MVKYGAKYPQQSLADMTALWRNKISQRQICWRKTHLRDENYENNDHRHWSRWRQFCGAKDTDAWGPLRPKSSWRQRGLRPLHSCIRAALLRLGSFFATHFSFRLHLFWCWDEHHAGQKWLNQEKHARVFLTLVKKLDHEFGWSSLSNIKQFLYIILSFSSSCPTMTK